LKNIEYSFGKLRINSLSTFNVECGNPAGWDAVLIVRDKN